MTGTSKDTAALIERLKLRKIVHLAGTGPLSSPDPDCAAAAQALEAMQAALEKIDEIRNSIIGLQSINWSAHIYPLVAALEQAGFKGEGYDVAREKMVTLVERERRAEALAAENVRLLAALKEVAHHADDDAGFMVQVRAALAPYSTPPATPTADDSQA